jgi:hypothetical protein
MNNADPLLLITAYRQRFVGSTAEQIVLDACEDAIRTLREERDEARRDLCYAEAADLSVAEAYNPRPIPYHPSQAHKIASERGWDCFKDEPISTGEGK